MPDHSPPNYSQNWHTLKSLLTGYSRGHRTREKRTFDDHARASALALFLSRAKLATRRLDRPTVEKLISGEEPWPRTGGLHQFDKIDLSPALLEDFGLIAFYGDWCTVCPMQIPHADKIDPSLLPVVQAIERLQDIRFGRNDLISPFYACPVDDIKKAFSGTFGDRPISTLLPELRQEGDEFRLFAWSTTFDSLVSTYLWQELRKTTEIEEAFDRWMLCQRVYFNLAMPVEFDVQNWEESKQFNGLLLKYLAEDVSLGKDSNELLRQLINADRFASLVSPIKTTVTISVGAEESPRPNQTEFEELTKPTLESLGQCYPVITTAGLDEIQFVTTLGNHSHADHLNFFYTQLIFSGIDAGIILDGQMLSSTGFTETLLELAASRPALKYVLFSESPFFSRASFNLLMLSRSEWCDAALHNLSQRIAYPWHRDGDVPAQYFDKGYQLLVRDEYLRAIGNSDLNGERLVRMAEMLGERCSLQSENFARSFEYEFLATFLEGFTHKQLLSFGNALSVYLDAAEHAPHIQRAKHHRYFLGFWALERLDNLGVDSTNAVCNALRESLLAYYHRDFSSGVQGVVSNLQPSLFFSTLPWYRLVTSDVSPMMAFSNDVNALATNIQFAQNHAIDSSSAIRQHLQVLMHIGQSTRLPDKWVRVARRVTEIVHQAGFGDRTQGIFLFDTFFYREQYDLWGQFCSYSNGLPDDVYEDFFDRCVPRIPLNQLLTLRERTTVLARAEQLQNVIARRQFEGISALGLIDLEKAFISACDAGDTDLATRITARARDLLSREPIATSKEHQAIHLKKTWLSYGYKWDLMLLFDELKADPKTFEKEAMQKPVPHAHAGPYSPDFRYWRDCDCFRRYIIAAAYRDREPAKCVQIMEVLVEETGDRNHSFLLFTGRLACLSVARDANDLRHALVAFCDSLKDIAPAEMPITFVASILEAYRKLGELAEMESFWSKLSIDQRNRIDVLRPYCSALIAYGEHGAAAKIIKSYRLLNHQTSEALGLDDLMSQLDQATSNDLTMRDIAKMVTESLHRTTLQLAKHYSEIVSKPFDDYVAIVGHGKTSAEFLYEVACDVVGELLLRKKNLKIHDPGSKATSNTRITKEDLINDWFVSLFDKRMAEARIGIRDQKRAGASNSGAEPGASDGFITDQKNKRVAIFEAFRLFSVETSVISEHLNKIAKYDNECLSPVFIVAYCDVADFRRLAEGYRAYVAGQDYFGFVVDPVNSSVELLQNTSHLWVAQERRWRGEREVTFYHFLINLSH